MFRLSSLFLIGSLIILATSARSEDNIALHKTYTMTPAPNYVHCTDANDGKDLTDGIHADGLFWCQKPTVGLASGKAVFIVDLEKEEPICGVSYSTAAGHGGVVWPRSINIFASNDKEHWEDLGDLLAPALGVPCPKPTGYQTHKYATTKLKGKGRYVMFLIRGIYYTFCDELEIYRGPDQWLAELKPAYAITNDGADKLANERFIASGAINRLIADLNAAMAAAQNLQDTYKARLLKDAQKLQPEINAMTTAITSGLFPLNDTHKKIFALNAYVLQNKGYARPFLWKSNRWDDVHLNAVPDSDKPAPLSISMMKGEVRSESINITNPTLKDQTFRISVKGLPAAANLELSEILTNEISNGAIVASCLKPLDKANPAIEVPAGCTRQVWLRLNRPGLAAGKYHASIIFSGAKKLKGTLDVTLHDFTFPKEPTLHVGGWDYTNCLGADDRYHDEACLKRNIAMMRDLYCDTTWGTRGVVPGGAKFDADGHLLNPDGLNFTAWDNWMRFWDKPKYYCVFWNEQGNGGKFAGFERGTPAFENAVSEFSKAWIKGLEKRGIKSEQLILHIYDEPSTKEHEDYLVTWAKAIKKTCPRVLIYNDPNHENPATAGAAFYDSVDLMCPNETFCESHDKAYRDFFVKFRERPGKTLWLYSCCGPAHTQNPNLYHRGQMWHAFDMGATGSFFWAMGFGSISPDDCFECYSSSGFTFSPYFCSQDRVMHSKHSEAMREGVQDYEYMLTLRKRIADLRKNGEKERADKLQARMDAIVGKAMAYLNVYPQKNIQNNVLDDACTALLALMDEAR